ncbi:MAG: hypothetical protein ACR2QV_16100 [Gammaproteobacteria bacterium]
MIRILPIAAALVLVCDAYAVDLTLDRVVSEGRSGQVRLRLENKASFQFDPETETLTSAGTWVAQNVVGPNQIIRYSHKVEDFRADIENGLAFRSYECVEGTFGTLLLANVCGNYRYGENMTDDGGLIDDVIVGPPKTLTNYELSMLSWDGAELIVVLSKPDVATAEPYPDFSLTLTFVAPAKPAAPEWPLSP